MASQQSAAALQQTQAYRRAASLLLQSTASAPDGSAEPDLAQVGRTLALRSLSDGAGRLPPGGGGGGLRSAIASAPTPGGSSTLPQQQQQQQWQPHAATDDLIRTLLVDDTSSNEIDPRSIAWHLSQQLILLNQEQPPLQLHQLTVLEPDFLCPACGCILHPSPHQQSDASIRLRPLKRGKTRRRRAGRVRARDFVRDELVLRKSRGGGREWGTPTAPTVANAATPRSTPASGAATVDAGHGHLVATHLQSNQQRRAAQSIRNVRNGTYHHCVVYTCGKCGTKTKFGGVSVVARERRRKMTKGGEEGGRGGIESSKKTASKKRGRASPAAIGSKETLQATKQPVPTAASTAGAVGDIAADEDFISLGPPSPSKKGALASAPAPPGSSSGGKTSSIPSSKQQQNSSYSFKQTASHAKRAGGGASPATPATMRLDQQQGGKKKRKNKGSTGGSGDKKSKLMDFLSSLND